MIEVRMNLEEFDAIREELAIYKEIVEALTTPKSADEWELNYRKDHPNMSIHLESEDVLRMDISKKSRELLTSILNQKVADIRKEEGITTGEYEIRFRASLGYISED